MRLIFLYVFILISCESKVDTHQSNMELLDDVVNIHDELMVKMKDLKSLKNELTQDGVESDNQLILELDNARSSMMKFISSHCQPVIDVGKNVYNPHRGLECVIQSKCQSQTRARAALVGRSLQS